MLSKLTSTITLKSNFLNSGLSLLEVMTYHFNIMIYKIVLFVIFVAFLHNSLTDLPLENVIACI